MMVGCVLSAAFLIQHEHCTIFSLVGRLEWVLMWGECTCKHEEQALPLLDPHQGASWVSSLMAVDMLCAHGEILSVLHVCFIQALLCCWAWACAKRSYCTAHMHATLLFSSDSTFQGKRGGCSHGRQAAAVPSRGNLDPAVLWATAPAPLTHSHILHHLIIQVWPLLQNGVGVLLQVCLFIQFDSC